MLRDLKIIKDVLVEAWKIDEYTKILELQQQLSEMQNKALELEKENKELKDLFTIKENISFKNNAYYKWEDWPFCSRCWDKDKNLIRIIPLSIWDNYANCPDCKNHFNFTWKENDQMQVFSPDMSTYY